jgi:hypothetical protein
MRVEMVALHIEPVAERVELVVMHIEVLSNADIELRVFLYFVSCVSGHKSIGR